MCRPPPPSTLQAMLGHVLPKDTTIVSVKYHLSHRLSRAYTIVFSDTTSRLLILSPPPSLRLLRHERLCLESEASTLRYLAQVSSLPTIPVPIHSSLSPPSSTDTLSPYILVPFPRGVPFQQSQSQQSPNLLSRALHQNQSQPPSPKEPPSHQLSNQIRNQINKLASSLAQITSPTNKFGPIPSVVDSIGGPPSNTWSDAFHLLLESILRDGEDMGVTIPYVSIRRLFKKWRWALDGVTVGRLTVVDQGLGNLLVDEAGEAVGFDDWSGVLFGDPSMGSLFSVTGEGGWDGAIEGQDGGVDGGKPRGMERDTGMRKEDCEGIQEKGGEVISGDKERRVRLLLYGIYHALVAVVREFYRPRGDGSSREMAARKRLGEALSKLNELSVDSKRKSTNGEMSPAKRLRSEE